MKYRDPKTGRFAPNRHRVFVYGTLMKGHGNHRLLERATFLGAAITKDEYTMLYAGIPWVIPAVQGLAQGRVRGEVYEVDSYQLLRLDQLEGYSERRPREHCHYTREEIEFTYADPPCAEWSKAFIYIGGARAQALAHVHPHSNHVLSDPNGCLRYPGMNWEREQDDEQEDTSVCPTAFNRSSHYS